MSGAILLSLYMCTEHLKGRRGENSVPSAQRRNLNAVR